MNNFVFPIPTIDWWAIWPVLAVSIGGIVALMLEVFRSNKNNTSIIWSCMIALAAAAGLLLVQWGAPNIDTFNQMVYRDRWGMVLQLMIIGVTFLTVVFSEEYLREKRIPFGEFYPLVLWSAAGAMIMVSTKSLLMLFIGLEVLSISLYVLAGMSKHESRSEESAIKYFLLGAFGSAFLLYGIAFLYGATGSIHLDAVVAATQSPSLMVKMPLVFGTALILIGLGFKAGLVPFHQWTPDVYQGAPTNVTAFMATASKIAAIGALFRVLEATNGIKETWMPFLFVVAILTMVVGNVVALVQTNVKRMLGYSSIANAGYLLVALLAYAQDPGKVGSGNLAFFLVSYAATTLGIFALLTLVSRMGKESTEFEDLHGLWKREPFAALCIVILCCSLIGIPITAGFFAKLFVFFDALQTGLAPLAIVMAITSVISIAYYLKLMRAAFVEQCDEVAVDTQVMKPSLKFAAAICCVLVIGLAFGSSLLTSYLRQESVAIVKLDQP